MKFVLLASALVLAGCAEPVYLWSKSGPHSFERDSQACKDDVARQVKASPPNYVGKEGAYLPRSGEWSQRTYNSCMRAAGYTPTGETSMKELAASTPKTAPAPAAAAPSTVTTNMAGRLRELRGLLDQGLITQSEYDQRREALLSAL